MSNYNYDSSAPPKPYTHTQLKELEDECEAHLRRYRVVLRRYRSTRPRDRKYFLTPRKELRTLVCLIRTLREVRSWHRADPWVARLHECISKNDLPGAELVFESMQQRFGEASPESFKCEGLLDLMFGAPSCLCVNCGATVSGRGGLVCSVKCSIAAGLVGKGEVDG